MNQSKYKSTADFRQYKTDNDEKKKLILGDIQGDFF